MCRVREGRAPGVPERSAQGAGVNAPTGVRFGGGKFYAVCTRCEKRPALPHDEYCEECTQNMAEAAYERQQEEGFRGGESAAFTAEEQARIQRELK